MTQTVPHRLALQASTRPDDVAAAVVGAGSLTFAAWEARSNAAARGLIERGVRRGDRLVLLADSADWLDYSVAYLAAQKAGAIAVPVATRMGVRHLHWALAETDAVGVVGVPPQAQAGFSRWTRTVSELADGQSTEPLPLTVGPDDDAEVLCTSGTTGVARGVVATHANLLAAHGTGGASEAPRRVLHSLPPATMVGQGLLLLPLHSAPHTVFVLPRFDSVAFLAAISAQGITDVVLVPALAAVLIRADPSICDLSSVRLVRSTSAAIAPTVLRDLRQLFPAATVVNMYASTESWPARTRLVFDPERSGSVGRPSRTSSVRIVDAHGRLCEPGAAGDVQLNVGEHTTMRSYYRDPDATARVFLPGGWVRTGDTGYLDDEGYLFLVDRNVDLVNVGGLNVSTIEVEGILQEHEAVVAAAVVGVPHAVLGEQMVAFVELADDVSTDALRAFAEARLGRERTPTQFVVSTALPRNALGKVLKRELREHLAARVQDQEATSAPTTPAERTIAAIWARCLDIELDGIRREDRFFALGGTSLSVMDVSEEVGEAFAVEADPVDLFTADTLADYALRVAAAAPRSANGRPQPSEQAHDA